jgi:hypothetical protein
LTHRRLKSQAALAGQSLNEFLLARISEIARTPTVGELAERIRARAPYAGRSAGAAVARAFERSLDTVARKRVMWRNTGDCKRSWSERPAAAATLPA